MHEYSSERDNTCSQAPQNKLVPQDDRGFVTKDSGERQSFESGMVRDTTAGKVQWHRVADGPMLKRWAELLTRGAEKYPDVDHGVPNWTLADGFEELHRFKQSAFRHFMQWYNNEQDEDHAAAVMFNVNGYEYTLRKMFNEDEIRDPAA